MIAWNGLEKFRKNLDLVDPEDAILSVQVEPRCPMGRDISQAVWDRQIKCKWVKIL